MGVKFWRWPLANQILAGLILGVGAGLLVRSQVETDAARALWTAWVEPGGKVFIRLIFMVVIPLLFSALVLGVAELGDVKKMGRVGLRALGFTVLLSASSVAVSLSLVNFFQPGRQMSVETREALKLRYGGEAAGKVQQAQQATPLADTLLNLIPQNPLAEAVTAFQPQPSGGGLLAVMVFSLLFGVALAMSPPTTVATLLDVLRGLFAVCMTIIGLAMHLAPLGVACLGFTLVLKLGPGILQSLAAYTGVVLLGLALQLVGVYSLLLRLLAGRSPVWFFRESREALVTAFGTSSSNATLPVSLRVAEQRLQLPPQISRFVLTVGASANQNGTALYEGVTVLFLAQVFGIDLSLTQQAVVALMCMLASLGTAGVPGGSLPLVAGVLATVGVPPESIAIILGIDRFLDMCRTTLNVAGDLVCAVLVTGRLPPST